MVQIAGNTLVSFCHLLLLGLGLGLIYRSTRILDVSFAATISCSCYAFYWVVACLNQNWMLGIVFALTIGTCLALCVHRYLLLDRSNKKSASLDLLLASLGVYVVLQGAVAIAFGNDMKVIQHRPVEVGHQFCGVYLTDVQLLTMTAGIVLFSGVLIVLSNTRLGRAIRAVSSNSDLSEIMGIDVGRTKLWTVGIGTGLGAIAGILSALDSGMTPTMGFGLLVNGLIVMIVGGVGSVGGLLGGALLLALAQNLTSYYLADKWMNAVAFLILIGFLIWKPLGFSGRRLKKVEI